MTNNTNSSNQDSSSNPFDSFLSAIQVTVKKDIEEKYSALKKDFHKEVEEIKEISQKELAKIKPRPVVIKINNVQVSKSTTERFHNKFEAILKTVSCSIPLFLTGDAGSGKTTIAHQVAKALNLEYYCISVCVQTSETAFLGYKNAHGDYVPTLFRKAYEDGGVFLIDEIDNGNPNILSVLNSAIANDCCAFPDGMIHKNENFRIIVTGNTTGRGADRKYVGRLEMDLATLDRFAIITVDYDENIEKFVANPSVVEDIQMIRKICFDKNIRLVVSPRASINISKLLVQGIKTNDALDMCVFKGCSDSVKTQIINELKRSPKYQNKYLNSAGNIAFGSSPQVDDTVVAVEAEEDEEMVF